MKLYLVQHGLSVPEEKDPKKPLSEDGRNETKKTARFLKAENINNEASPQQATGYPR